MKPASGGGGRLAALGVPCVPRGAAPPCPSHTLLCTCRRCWLLAGRLCGRPAARAACLMYINHVALRHRDRGSIGSHGRLIVCCRARCAFLRISWRRAADPIVLLRALDNRQVGAARAGCGPWSGCPPLPWAHATHGGSLQPEPRGLWQWCALRGAGGQQLFWHFATQVDRLIKARARPCAGRARACARLHRDPFGSHALNPTPQTTCVPAPEGFCATRKQTEPFARTALACVCTLFETACGAVGARPIKPRPAVPASFAYIGTVPERVPECATYYRKSTSFGSMRTAQRSTHIYVCGHRYIICHM